MPPSSPTAQVLVVDDEPDLRTLYELTLLREGYRVDAAGTLGEAWQLLEQRRFDAVITASNFDCPSNCQASSSVPAASTR